MDNTPNTPTSPASPEPGPAQTDRRYYWFLIIYLVLLSALGSFVNDMYTPSLPQIARDFHSSPSQSQLSLTMGMIGLAIGQLLLGPISDRYGRKPVLIISILVFIAGAVISVFSTSMTFFLMCRLIQGMGASGGYFLARTIPADIFHGRELAKFMAIIGAVNGLAPASAMSCTAPPSYSWSCSYSSSSSPSSPTASSPTSTRNTHSVSLRMA